MAKKILIVDDEQNIVDILKFNLRKEGYETIEVMTVKKLFVCVINMNRI